ncbi:MAG: hypothetical protein FJ123_00800 [Deltaproteobacteria bacterium]|nr:hypothetical protein [Deltaproteobacteria bacterium]
MRLKHFWAMGLFLVYGIFLLSPAESLAGEEKYLILEGTLKSIEGNRWIEVENEKDMTSIHLRIGWKTVYTPHRHPIPGERVKVQYLVQKGTPVAHTVAILEAGAPKSVSKESPPKVAQKQEEIETKERVTSQTSPPVDQPQTAPPVPKEKKEQPIVVTKEPSPKRIESKPLEQPKTVEKTVDSFQTTKVEEPKKAEIPPVETPKPASIEQIKPIVKPTKVIVPETKRMIEPQGAGIGGIIIYFIPLIIGAAIGSVTYWGKTNSFVNGINKFDAWVMNKWMVLKEEEGKGKIKRYWAVPILWIVNGIIKLSENIKNEAVRCGAKTSAYLYLIGIIAIITFYAVVIVLVIIFLIIALWVTALILGWSGRERVKVPTQTYVESVKQDRLLEDIFLFSKTEFEKLKDKFENRVGRVDNDGKIYSNDIFPVQIGLIDSDGTVYNTEKMFREKVGRIDEDGRVHDY